jgi:cytoplasmic tRNA 2-thiolation protein 1
METCNKCKRNPTVYHRVYSGEKLCKRCFLNSIERKVQHAMSKYSMVKFGDHVAVAVSGGKDSLVLLSILKSVLSKAKGVSLRAITIDEGIGGYRDESLKIVSEFSYQLDVPFTVFSYKDLFGIQMDEAMQLRSSAKFTSCSICGTFRRRAIDLAAEQVGANVVATAHNLDDELQTYMINFLAGDVDRMGWNQPSSIYRTGLMKKIKPLVGIYEREIVFYALQKGIPFQSEQCPYMKESIREDIREFINRLEYSHPGIKYNAYKSLVDISTYIRDASSSEYFIRGTCDNCGRDCTGQLCSVCKTLQNLKPLR